MARMNVLALMHDSMVPPADVSGIDVTEAVWKMEFDVVETLDYIGHAVIKIGVGHDLHEIHGLLRRNRPDIVFNLLEDFADVPLYDQNVVSYLELMGLPYTGCNPRGLFLARDKALTKQILAYNGVPVPEFWIFPRGRRFRPPPDIKFPAIVKSLNQDASAGISQASVVHDSVKLQRRIEFMHERVRSDALVERYVDGRELYVGLLGNDRPRVFPIWEMYLSKLPKGSHRIATGQVKWNAPYQKRYKIRTGKARGLKPPLREKINRLCRRAYRLLGLTGYARIDLRLTGEGDVYVLEANPNPQLAYGEDFAESAERAGISYESLIQRILHLGTKYYRATGTGLD